MTILTNFLSSLILAIGLGLLTTFAIQNVTPASLKFLLFESIQLPISILLAFCFGMGLLFGALMPILWQRKPKKKSRFDDLEEEFDF
jgi:putative membrane protein